MHALWLWWYDLIQCAIDLACRWQWSIYLVIWLSMDWLTRLSICFFVCTSFILHFCAWPQSLNPAGKDEQLVCAAAVLHCWADSDFDASAAGWLTCVMDLQSEDVTVYKLKDEIDEAACRLMFLLDYAIFPCECVVISTKLLRLFLYKCLYTCLAGSKNKKLYHRPEDIPCVSQSFCSSVCLPACLSVCFCHSTFRALTSLVSPNQFTSCVEWCGIVLRGQILSRLG